MAQNGNPFKLDLNNYLPRVFARTLERPVSSLLALKHLAAMYDKVSTECHASGEDFVKASLNALNVTYNTPVDALKRIPTTGPCVIVANHPYGGLEGVMIIDMLRKIRSDVKIMANFLLGRVPEVRENFIFVDPFGRESSTKKNLLPLRQTLGHLRNGGLLVVFPSGTVSHFHWSKREVTDPEWSDTIGRIIQQAKCPVVPVFFSGRNGIFFQMAGVVHPLLRTALLPRQLYNKRGKCFNIRIGNNIPFSRVASFETPREVTDYLRLRTYILGSSIQGKTTELDLSKLKKKAPHQRTFEPVIPPVDPKRMEQEVLALPPTNCLANTSSLSVYYAKAEQIPNVLREIGRLREITFRAVQEGTGKSVDLDRYDKYYLHLFTWNHAKREVAGAYRLVHADKVLKTHGVRGLYTHSLFAYRAKLLRQIGPSIELGRSFVRPEYQKQINSLHLLWRGIIEYVMRHPKYKGLFGTVSISSEYDSVSRYLIATFLKTNRYLPELAKLIRPRNPMPRTPPRGVDRKTQSVVVRELKDVNELIAEIETKQKSVPVLLRQYLKFGVKLLGFNVDKSFGNVLDGLIFVDLSETELKLLKHYVGYESAVRFLRCHNKYVSEDEEETVARSGTV